MSEYQLYCFAQSGNAYRAALMLNLIGADWQPVWIDFFGEGVQRKAPYRTEVNEMGEVPVLVDLKRNKKLTQSGVILNYLARKSGRFLPQGEDEELEALRWIIFDNQKVNGFLGPYRFLRIFAKPAGDPAVLAFLRGTHRWQPRHRQQAAGEVAVPARQAADHRRYLNGGLFLLPGRRVRLRYRQGPSGDRTVARTHEGPARLEAPVRTHAGLSARHALTT